MKKLFYNKNLGTTNPAKRSEPKSYQHSMFGYLLSAAIVIGAYFTFPYNITSFLIACVAAIVVFPYTSDKILEALKLTTVDRGATQAIRFLIATGIIIIAVHHYFDN